MMKSDEQRSDSSCFNKAHPDELVFVLLGRDAAAPHAVLAWINTRIRMGLNKFEDPEIQDAYKLATSMMDQRSEIRRKLGK